MRGALSLSGLKDVVEILTNVAPEGRSSDPSLHTTVNISIRGDEAEQSCQYCSSLYCVLLFNQMIATSGNRQQVFLHILSSKLTLAQKGSEHTRETFLLNSNVTMFCSV